MDGVRTKSQESRPIEVTRIRLPSASPPWKFRFMSLPLEIRIIIYDFVFLSKTTYDPDDPDYIADDEFEDLDGDLYNHQLDIRRHYSKRYQLSSGRSHCLSTAILRCSKQIYAEAVPSLYLQNQVYFDNKNFIWHFPFHKRDPLALRCIRNLRTKYCYVVDDVNSYDFGASNLAIIGQRCPNLTKITFHPSEDCRSADWGPLLNIFRLMIALMHLCANSQKAEPPTMHIEMKLSQPIRRRRQTRPDPNFLPHMIDEEACSLMTKYQCSHFTQLKKITMLVPAYAEDFLALRHLRIGSWGFETDFEDEEHAIDQTLHGEGAYLDWRRLESGIKEEPSEDVRKD